MAIRDEYQTLLVAPRNVPTRCYVNWYGQLAVWERVDEGVFITGVDPGHTGRVFHQSVDMVTDDVRVYVNVAEPPAPGA